MRHVMALNKFENVETSGSYHLQTLNIHRLVVFIGPLFFILGMVNLNFFLIDY